jgi:hypothetical protein
MVIVPMVSIERGGDERLLIGSRGLSRTDAIGIVIFRVFVCSRSGGSPVCGENINLNTDQSINQSISRSRNLLEILGRSAKLTLVTGFVLKRSSELDGTVMGGGRGRREKADPTEGPAFVFRSVAKRLMWLLSLALPSYTKQEKKIIKKTFSTYFTI